MKKKHVPLDGTYEMYGIYTLQCVLRFYAFQVLYNNRINKKEKAFVASRVRVCKSYFKIHKKMKYKSDL